MLTILNNVNIQSMAIQGIKYFIRYQMGSKYWVPLEWHMRSRESGQKLEEGSETVRHKKSMSHQSKLSDIFWLATFWGWEINFGLIMKFVRAMKIEMCVGVKGLISLIHWSGLETHLHTIRTGSKSKNIISDFSRLENVTDFSWAQNANIYALY